ncbi:MAG TPA: Do family serine endopeptidase [Caulobacteraceae bacterium]|jgi:serine protease Do|nr:Do family serine endopeptidase [Caulobacteraceae bacterium]
MAVTRTHVVIGAVAGAGIAVAAMAGAGMHTPVPGFRDQGQLMNASLPVLPSAPGQPQSFADIFEKVSPAVVSIDVTSRPTAAALNKIPGMENFPFDLVPRGQGGQGQGGLNGTPTPAPKQMSAGSGFFVSPDGYIVTNNHVVDNALEIKVVLKDGKELKGTVVGRDEGTDLAVVKVEGHNYPYVDFENSAKPRVGDWVLAVGNPFSLGSTATAGIVSAYNRDLGENFVDYIQIDAPVNRGNSGGPTFDTYGRVIGVNTMIFSPSGGSVGIGFDIPADVAASVTKQLIATGKIQRGYIGATIQPLSDEMADSFGLGGRKGAVVADVVPNGPAQRAGVLSGDVVVAVNGRPINSYTEMTREVAKVPAGEVARLDVFRDGKEHQIDVHTALRPSETQLAQNGGDGQEQGGDIGSGPRATPGSAVLGMNLMPLGPAARQEFNLSENARGVVVAGVTGDASDKGLQRGDVIVRAGDRLVANAGDVAAAVNEWKKAGRKSIPLAITRGGRTLFVPVKIEG